MERRPVMKIDSMINVIICGDCLDIMRDMPDNSVDLVVTSPPYNIGANNIETNQYATSNKYNHMSDTITDYFAWSRTIINECLRIAKYHVFWNVMPCAANKTDVFRLIGGYSDKMKELMMWFKSNPPPPIEKGVLASSYEFVLCLSNDSPGKRKFYHADFPRGVTNSFWGKVNSGNPYCKIHSAVMPEDIPNWLISNFSFSGDIVLDPFSGTGTTSDVAKRLGRRYIGIDISPEYCEIARKRLEAEEKGITVKELEKGQGSLF
jgi:DNA modification methylase